MSYKFIFDTSAIDSVSINKFQNAGLKEKCANKQFIFYITPPLLWECLGMISKQNISDTVVNLFKFILTLDKGGIFNELDEILTGELEGLPLNNFLFSNNSLEEQAMIKAIGGEQPNNKDKTYLEKIKKEIEKGKNGIRDFYKRIRDSSKPQTGYSFCNYSKSSFSDNAILYIKEHMNSKKQKDILVDFWQENKSKCPYFNKFIEGMMFLPWYAQHQRGRGMGIDKNGMDDIEHLVYLLGVDGVVAGENGFLKAASQEVFPEKDFLSVDEFVDKISKR